MARKFRPTRDETYRVKALAGVTTSFASTAETYRERGQEALSMRDKLAAQRFSDEAFALSKRIAARNQERTK